MATGFRVLAAAGAVAVAVAIWLTTAWLLVVWAKVGPGVQHKAKPKLTGTSESDQTKSDHGTCRLL
ncbi:hypothetical protein ACFYTC_06800 [Actinomadura nitritigenes]|uniref:hypothetical protein n=1 Tax=Actinomadura nitritigenes TaxID=134602 RepID=UPI0036AA1A3C